MNKEQIEQAAKEDSLWFAIKGDEDKESLYKAAFINGAEWRINSVWHRTNERPENGRLILCIRGGGAFALISGPNNSQFCKHSYECGFEYWAYVDDLLPNTKQQ